MYRFKRTLCVYRIQANLNEFYVYSVSHLNLVIAILTWRDKSENSLYFDDHIFISLTLRRLMSCIYGAPILDVSRSHTTTQHSR